MDYEDLVGPQHLTLREFRPFKTSDEYLWAMKEDLSEWLNVLYPSLNVCPEKFMESLETGVALCKHANNVLRACNEWISLGKKLPKIWYREWTLPKEEVIYNSNARAETFFARDNLHNFITWCRKLGIFECLLFESDDLIMRKNEKNVILCLLEVARRGSHFGMAAPLLVQFEKEIDRDIAKDTGQDLSSSGEEEESFLEYGPIAQIITNDLRSLDEMVRELVERCKCPTQFPMIRVAEGKYRIGNTKAMIYVRILRNHVMVRVGGGWDTLEHYLDKHDPCRCSSGHRATISSKLTIKNDENLQTPRMKVEYERRDLPYAYDQISTQRSNGKKYTGIEISDSSSEISDEGYKTSDNIKFLIKSAGSPNGESRVHQSRKSSLSCVHSQSTDEERPDSRSTDEDLVNEINLQSNQGSILKSSRGRVSNEGNYRSFSSERSQSKILRKKHSESPLGQKINTNGTMSSLKLTPPTRSLSASGSSEFYSCKTMPKSTFSAPNKAVSKTPTSIGKNTWNGQILGRVPKKRPNLLTKNLFSKDAEDDEKNGNNLGNDKDLPNLADYIKRALELGSDADKISFIELAIKQFEEQKKEISTHNSNIKDSTYSCTSKNNKNQFLMIPDNSILTIRKRKENGATKIPKPSFY